MNNKINEPNKFLIRCFGLFMLTILFFMLTFYMLDIECNGETIWVISLLISQLILLPVTYSLDED